MICPPLILQNGKTSTVHAAVDVACHQISLHGVREYLRHKRFLILDDLPDNAKTMKKRQAFVGKQLADLPGALFVPRGCAAHKVHRIVVASCEDRL